MSRLEPSPRRGDDLESMDLPSPRRTVLRRLSLRVEQAHALSRWVAEARKRSNALDASFETIERDSRVGGGMLAGALSYRLFVFALPLAFFVVSGLGLLTSALGINAHVLVSSVGAAGIVAKQVESASKGPSNWWAALTSFVVVVYATRILLRAVAIVHSLAWERAAHAVKVSPRSLGIFGAAIVGQLVLLTGVGAAGHQTAIAGIVALLVFVFGLAGIWLLVSLELPHSTARWTDLLPGSALYAVGIVGVQLFNVLILGMLLQSKSTTYGALGTAAALLLSFFLIGRVIVLAAVLNVTLYERRR